MVEIVINSDQEVYQIIVVGDVDASSSIHLDNAMSTAIEQNESKIMVDCVGLAYISSAGLGVFMSYLEDLKANNARFVIYGLNDKVKYVFNLIGLENLFTIVSSKEEAIKYLNDLQA